MQKCSFNQEAALLSVQTVTHVDVPREYLCINPQKNFSLHWCLHVIAGLPGFSLISGWAATDNQRNCIASDS